jgi:uncharacterized protein
VAEARSYFDLARSMLEVRPARLIAIGGLSGSGKTTIAEALAVHVGTSPGARIVDSDRIRKALHGVAPETRLPEKAYRPEVSANVYREMAWRASLILAEGGSVVADAVFDNAANRKLIETAARDAGVPFAGVWLETDPSVLWQQVGVTPQPCRLTRCDLSGPLPRGVLFIAVARTNQAGTHRRSMTKPCRSFTHVPVPSS